ncbi:GT-D fold domain-containing protein [Allostella humosa]|uniref:GT-D fold domain-containing protein n=1 Tax=Stella humosa TaxID=94 RepID=UPI0014776CE3|nr:glycosyltransferase [Stella humosa]
MTTALGPAGPPMMLRFGRDLSNAIEADHRISCILVARGSRSLARLAIGAFQAQTWPHRELVIVDDGDEGLAGHIEDLADRRIHLVRPGRRGRPSDALLERGIAEALGPFICRWDEDCLHDPLRLELQFRALAMQRATACVLARRGEWEPDSDRLMVSAPQPLDPSLLCRRSAMAPGGDGPGGAARAAVSQHRVVHLDLPQMLLAIAPAGQDARAGRSALTPDVAGSMRCRLPLAAFAAALREPLPAPSAASIEGSAATAVQAMREGRFEDAFDSWSLVIGRDGGSPADHAGRIAAQSRFCRPQATHASWRDLADRFPTAPEGPYGLGRSHLAAGRDGAARRAFEMALARAADHLPSRIELAILRVDQGQDLQAEDELLRLAALAPAEPRIARALAIAAMGRLDWPLALQRWQKAWDDFGAPSAPQRIAVCLATMGRTDEAWAVIEGVPGAIWDKPTRIRIKCRIGRLLHDFGAVLAALEADLELATADDELRDMLIEAWTNARRADQAADLAARFGIGRDPRHQERAIQALIAADRSAEADRHLLALATPAALHRTSPRLLRRILAVQRRHEGPTAARRALDAIVSSDDVTRTMRLSALFEGEFEESRAALEEGRPLPPALSRDSATFASASAWRAEIPRSWPGDPLRRAWDALRIVRHRSAGCLLDVSTNLAQAMTVADRIARAIATGQPLSVVRLGDGEGNFLPYADGEEPQRRLDQANIQQLWWGRHRLGEDDLGAIEQALAAAVRVADIVGIPDEYRLALALGRPEAASGEARGLLAVVEQFAGYAPAPTGGALFGPRQIITGSNFNNALAAWGLWEPLLGRIGACAVVTGRPDLAAALTTRFGLRVERTFAVPPEAKYLPPSTPGQHHYRDVYARTLEALATVRPGQVVLVAAGILGKIYCARIREAGGIAIDVGSVADGWCGHVTRRIDESATYGWTEDLAAAFARRPDLDAAFPALRPATGYQPARRT